MDNSLGTGFMAVFAVSGSVVLLSMQVHKRLLSNFMEKMEFEIKNSTGSSMKDHEITKKRVRFSDDVASEATADDGKSGGKKYKGINSYNENLEAMPKNWQAMYKGILQYRNLKGCD